PAGARSPCTHSRPRAGWAAAAPAPGRQAAGRSVARYASPDPRHLVRWLDVPWRECGRGTASKLRQNWGARLLPARVLFGLGHRLRLAQPAALAGADQARHALVLLGPQTRIGGAGLERRRVALGSFFGVERLFGAGHHLGLGPGAPAAVG